MGVSFRCAVFVLTAAAAAGQSSNDTPLNNGADVAVFMSDPSVGSAGGVFGDLFWRAHTGANMISDVDAGLGGSFMEIDGYYGALYDSDWSTTPHFYVRHHVGMVGLLPDLAGLAAGAGVTVLVGPSGFGSPCTIAPSICSPATTGAMCGPAGFVLGWITDIGFGATVGSGVVITAGGLAGDDIATVYEVPGGMTVFSGPPGPCGFGDYAWQAFLSTDETQADLSGGINPSSGFQVAGGGLTSDGVATMVEPHETWRGNVLNAVAQTSAGTGIELGTNGGGALNGRNLAVGSGTARLGVEVRDFAAAAGPNLAFGAASLGSLANPGVPVLGANLLILPDTLFNTTAGVWSGPVAPVVFNFTPEAAFSSGMLPVPPTAAGAVLFLQGAVLDLTTMTFDSTNRLSVRLGP